MKSPPGFDTRPTTDKIKETLFNILQPDLPGAVFLDLFSGSGSIGIEALSRGARLCVFAENDPKAIKCINENLQHTRLDKNALVISRNVLSAINELSIKGYKFDIVCMDPPYDAGYEQNTLEALSSSGIITSDTQVIIEADKHNKLDFIDNTDFMIVREKEYKSNKHYFLRLK